MDKEEFMQLYSDIKSGKEKDLAKYDFKTLYRINELLLEEIAIREKEEMEKE